MAQNKNMQVKISSELQVKIEAIKTISEIEGKVAKAQKEVMEMVTVIEEERDSSQELMKQVIKV